MDVYDEDRNSWKVEAGPQMPAGKVIAAGGKIYALTLASDWSATGSRQSLRVLSHLPGSSEWKLAANLPLDRPRFEAEAVSGALYVVGYAAANEESKTTSPVLFRIP
jgi:hypothetical protein